MKIPMKTIPQHIQELLQQITAFATQDPENSETTEATQAPRPDESAYTCSHDEAGNAFYWYMLSVPQDIFPIAQLLFNHDARLAMITAYNRKHLQKPKHDICYHFEIAGIVINITVQLGNKNTSVPSITSIFANADWHEREMMELFDIEVSNQPNPRRLFLSEELDSGILGEAVPLSIMMNGACTVDLWERILQDRANENDVSSAVTTPQGKE